MRDDLLALLESGPMSSGDLTKALGPPTSRILSELRKLVREGLVTTVGPAKQWALVPIATVDPVRLPTPAAQLHGSERARSGTQSSPGRDGRFDSDRGRPSPTDIAPDELLIEDDPAGDDRGGLDEIAYEADVAPEVRRGRPLRQQATPETAVVIKGASWWCSAPQDGFTREAETHQARMRGSKEARIRTGYVE